MAVETENQKVMVTTITVRPPAEAIARTVEETMAAVATMAIDDAMNAAVVEEAAAMAA